MISKFILRITSRPAARFAAVLFSAFYCLRAAAAPFNVQGPGVNPNDFRITTFASGLDFPLGMARLSDGSLLVAVSQGTSLFNSTGRLLRFVDANEDGIADGPGTVLYSNLPGSQSAVCVAGDLILVTGQTKPMTVLRTGASPASPLTFVGRIGIAYPGSWFHPNSALGLRKTPGQTNSYDLLFQLGSDSNFAVTTRTATLTNQNILGATGILAGDSVFMLTITDNGTNVTAANLRQLASGLRNPAGYDDIGLAICRSPDVTLATIDKAIRMKLDRGTRIRMMEVKVLPLTETQKVDRMQVKTVLEGQR